MRTLIVESNSNYLESLTLSLNLGWPGVELTECRLGEDGISFAANQTPDIIILDLDLPDISGFEVTKSIRLFSKVPIVVIAEDSSETTVAKALELGADEFIIHPFRHLELVARVRAILRRTKSFHDNDINYGPFRFCPSSCDLIVGKRKICLTRTEGIIAQHLIDAKGETVSHERLSEAIWGDFYPGAAQAIKVYIGRLRAKIRKYTKNRNAIANKPGLGYSIKPLILSILLPIHGLFTLEWPNQTIFSLA